MMPAQAASPIPRPINGSTSLPALIDREQRRRRRRTLGWSVALAALPLLGGALWLALRPRPVPVAQRFRQEPLTRGELIRLVHATGHVEAVSTVQVGAELSGRIASVEVDFNDRVKRGQVMARFDRTSLEAQRAQIQASVAAARATSAQAQVDLEQARRNVLRADGLFARKAQSEADHDAAVTAERLAQARLHAADAQVAAQEAALALQRTNLDHAVIRAPVDGVVITRNIDPGQTVAAALQTPVLFTVAADLSKMRVIAAVDESDIGEVTTGQPSTFTVNAYPERTFEGVVTEVRSSPVIVQDVVTYGAVVEVANPDLTLKPGMTAAVRVRTAAVRDVLRVPNAALQFTPPGQHREGPAAVWVLAGDTPRATPVRIGISDGESTQLLEPGALSAGAPVLVELTPKGKKAYGTDSAH